MTFGNIVSVQLFLTRFQLVAISPGPNKPVRCENAFSHLQSSKNAHFIASSSPFIHFLCNADYLFEFFCPPGHLHRAYTQLIADVSRRSQKYENKWCVGSSCVSHCLSFLQLQRKVITYKERSVFKSIKIIHSSHCCLFTLLPLCVELQCQFLSRSGQFFNQSAFNLRTSPLSYYLGFVGLQANTLANPAYGKWYHLSRTPGELRAKTESSLGLTEGDIFKAPTDIYLFLFLF